MKTPHLLSNGQDLVGAHEGYFRPSGQRHVDDTNTGASPSAEFKMGQLRALVENPAFPCVGAKSAFGRKTYRIGLYGRMASKRATQRLAKDLYHFICELNVPSGELSAPFSTYIAIFDLPHIRSEVHAHNLTWKQLELLHHLDAKVYPYAQGVSSDPYQPDFAFSIGGRAFFIVGLNPCASRFSRRFAYPSLVFNAHSQFQELRRREMFELIQRTIRTRDQTLQGNLNPNLSSFGEQTEALQYSGLPVTEAARCPFQAIHPGE